MQRGPVRQLLAFVAFTLLFRYLFSWSWSMSIALLLSMFLHELGHAGVFAWAKIKFVILYLFPLGAVAAPISKEENERSDRLHWNTIAYLLQAGPAVNVALMLIFLAFESVFMNAQTSLSWVQFARDMVYVNGLLASMNLVPMWTLDAGQLFNVIYSSLDEHEDRWLTGILVGSVSALLLLLLGIPGFFSWTYILSNTLGRFGWVAFIIFFTVGILNKQGRDDPLHAVSAQAMSNRQVAVQLAIYLTLVGITLWIFAGPLF